MLTQIAACGELFHTATGTAFVDLLVDGHRETWPIRSKRFRGWLRRRYYEATGGALNGHAISSALDVLEARAQFDAPERSVHVRVAEHDGHIYLDLADEQWREVEIGPEGWRVNKFPPVRRAPTRSVGSRAAAVSRYVNSIPTKTRCFYKLPGLCS